MRSDTRATMVRMSDTLWTEYQERIFKEPPKGTKKMLSCLYRFNQFKGSRCFVIAGGASLRGFDFSRLENEFTIGVNKIGRVFQPNIVYLADPQLILKEAQRNRGCSVIVIADMENREYNDCYYVRTCGRQGIPGDIDKIYTGDNSGYGALNLAIAMGFNPIYLLGYDFKFTNGKSHYLDNWGCRDQYESHYLLRFKRELEILAPHTIENLIQIINLNPDSALEAFPKMKIEEVL